MEVLQVDQATYQKEVKAASVFGTAAFQQLNAYKVERVHYLIFKNTKKRFAICLGEKDGQLSCPFSAPFGCFEVLRQPFEIEYLEEAVTALQAYAVQNGCRGISITLPPLFYAETFLAALLNVMLRNGYHIDAQELNFQMDLGKLARAGYEESLPSNARNKLRLSLKSGLTLHHCTTLEEKKEVYRVIAVNRASRGFPLRMSEEQVLSTIQIVPHECFLVRKDEESVAAALIYHVTDKIAQVIYWGDVPGYNETKSMNYLAYEMARYYTEKGFQYLDIGPSTEHGVPNLGLCSFKTSIGCDISAKFVLSKTQLGG